MSQSEPPSQRVHLEVDLRAPAHDRVGGVIGDPIESAALSCRSRWCNHAGVMKTNRSVPQATVIPVLIYPDVREAVDWLCAAFGFAERVWIGDNHRAQLSFGEGALIVGDVRHGRRPPRQGEVTHSVMVRVEDVDAHCEQARARGAGILAEPTDFPYGERQYTAEDPAGHQWTFSQTLADVAPEEWGGISVGD
jgi:uncharacterized glyoxalase superfamily protein PhnB